MEKVAARLEGLETPSQTTDPVSERELEDLRKRIFRTPVVPQSSQPLVFGKIETDENGKIISFEGKV